MRSFPLKRAVLAGVASLALIGATLGAVAAQQPPAGDPTPTAPWAGPFRGKPAADRQAWRQQFLAAVAAKLNVTAEQLQQAMTEARNELGMPSRQGVPGQGRFGPRHGPMGPRGIGPFGGGLETAAQAMNISVDQLRQELPGKSLADVAQAHGVDPATVASALKAAAEARIDRAAAAGRIPADQVADAKQRAAERIDQMMTRQMPAGMPRRGPGR